MGAITVVISIFDVAISYATAYARPTGAIGPRVLYLRLARVCPIIVGQCNGLSRGTEPDILPSVSSSDKLTSHLYLKHSHLLHWFRTLFTIQAPMADQQIPDVRLMEDSATEVARRNAAVLAQQQHMHEDLVRESQRALAAAQ